MRPFTYTLDAVSIKESGSPLSPSGSVAFEQLISEAGEMIQNGVGGREGLEGLLAQRLTELARLRFDDTLIPDAMIEQINDDARVIALSVAESLSFVMVATIINFLGSSAGAQPLLSFAMTPADPVGQVPVPLVASAASVPLPV